MREETEVVPLRPGFDNEFRGFNRNQVIEHIELLEDQIKMLTMDRDEAARLNEDQRRITDHTRRQLEETAAALERLQNSETGLPHATQRMHNMLMMADEEARTIREHARREADTIRGTANTDAAQIRAEAEEMASGLRDECNELVNDLQQQRERLEEQHAARMTELESERTALERAAKESYDETMAAAQNDANELLRQTQQRCDELEEASTRYHSQVVEDLNQRAAQLERLRKSIVESLESMTHFAESAQASVIDEPKLEGQRPQETGNGHHPADHNGNGHNGNGHSGNGHSGNGHSGNGHNRTHTGDLDIPVQQDSQHSPETVQHTKGRPAQKPHDRAADRTAHDRTGSVPGHAPRQPSSAGHGSARPGEDGR